MDLQNFYDKKADKYIVCFDQDSVLNKMLKWVGAGHVVLDVGCSDGTFGAEIKKLGNKVFGIEVSKIASKKASHVLDGAIAANIENEDLPYKKKSFDIIICADVLEHLYDPLATLRKLKGYLKDNGKMIISVPNIAHSSIRRGLLFGKFEYTDIGLLDNSHIRFFTLSSAKDMIKKAGYDIEQFDLTTDFNKAINGGLNSFLRKSNWPILYGLFGYQFIFLLKKSLND